MSRMLLRPLARAPLLAAVLVLAGCVTGQSLITGQKQRFAYTWPQEVALGGEADGEMAEEFGLYDDPALTAYVTRVGERVLATSHLRRTSADSIYRATPFTFRVLDSPVINAFALPGGYVYVTRGLLAHLENEAQLAVVLGHEIGHVAARHASRRIWKAQLGAVAVAGASLLGEKWRGWGEEISLLGGATLSLVLFKHSRGDETESDRLGVEYASRAGFRAGEGADFFALLTRTREKQGWLPAFLSTHPDPGRREQTVSALAAELARQGVLADEVGQDSYLAAIDGIVVGDDPRLGYVAAESFVHPGERFRFTLPRGWKPHPARTGVQLSAPDGAGAALVLRREAEATSALAAANAYLRDQRGLTLFRATPGRVNGLAAHTVEASRVEGVDTSHLRLTWLEHAGRVYLFGGVAPAATHATYAPAFERAIGSFAPLTDRRLMDVQPIRLRVEPAPRAAALRALIPAALPPGWTAEDAALLNGLRLDDPVERGTPLKLWR